MYLRYLIAATGSIFWAMPVSELTVCGFLLFFMRKGQEESAAGEEHNGRIR